jgi:hypothetical protein
LAPNAKQLGIRIFGIAFTEEADFQLMQSLAQSTDGEYFRVLLAADIDGVFQQISHRLRDTAPVLPLLPSSKPDQDSKGSRLISPGLLGAGAGFLLLLIVVLFLVRQRRAAARAESGGEVPAGLQEMTRDLPETPIPMQMELSPAPNSPPLETSTAPLVQPPSPPTPAPLPPPPSTTPPVEAVIESITRRAVNMCPKHPAWKATEFCPECLVLKCKNCMTEKNGRSLCSDCAKKLQYR